tara:strand:+ start:947 stop:1129 length:183 start_codon:yes stop_codon:yes gene_type:complete
MTSFQFISIKIERSSLFFDIYFWNPVSSLDLKKYLECRDHKKMLDVDDAPSLVDRMQVLF